MTTQKEIEVVMIATDNKISFGKYLVINKEGKLCIWNTDIMGSQKTLPTQNLYFLSDEQPKVGDWYVNNGH